MDTDLSRGVCIKSVSVSGLVGPLAIGVQTPCRYGSGSGNFADDSQMSDVGYRGILQRSAGKGPVWEKRR